MNAAYHFDPVQSHRWAEHVDAWLSYLADHRNGRSDSEVCEQRKKLPKDAFGSHYTPVRTALLYGLGMDQQMQLADEGQRRVVAVTGYDFSEIDSRIEEDTNLLTELFIDDASRLAAHTGYKSRFDEIVNRTSGNYRNFSFSNEKGEWKTVLQKDSSHAQELIDAYVRSRLAQEYWILHGAATAYHLMAHGPGPRAVTALVKGGSEKIARRITDRLITVMEAAPICDKKGMTADHNIKTNGILSTLAGLYLLPTEVYQIFYNCPIHESYSVTERVLADRYGKTTGIDNSNMPFCGVCAEHGEQLMRHFIPPFMHADSFLAKKRPTDGGDQCDFSALVSVF